MNQPTKEQIRAYLEATITMTETIRELKSVPNGHLYALVMSKISLESYNKVIATVKKTGLVKESNHVLTWVGPGIS